MSALGHQRTLGTLIRVSAFLPKPDFVKRPFRPLFVHCAPELKATAFFPHYLAGGIAEKLWRLVESKTIVLNAPALAVLSARA